MRRQTTERKLEKLQIKYAHERDALSWAFDKAFELAEEERDVDTCFHLTTLGKIAKQYDIGIDNWQRWEKLRDEIEATAKVEDEAEDDWCEGCSEPLEKCTCTATDEQTNLDF